MDKLVLVTLLFGVALSLLVVLIDKFSSSNRWMKYMVPAFTFAICLFYLVRAKWFSAGMQDLGFVILAIIALGAGVIALAVAFVLDRRSAKRTS